MRNEDLLFIFNDLTPIKVRGHEYNGYTEGYTLAIERYGMWLEEEEKKAARDTERFSDMQNYFPSIEHRIKSIKHYPIPPN